MKRPRFWQVAIAVCGMGGAAAAATAPGTGEQWIAEYQRYAAQPHLENDHAYLDPRQTPPELRWTDLLRKLPPPEEWRNLRQQLAEAAKKSPRGLERQRLEAANWLLTYMLGEREALKAALPPAPANSAAIAGEEPEDDQTSRRDYAVANLRDSLREPVDATPEGEALKAFEEKLAWLEPVDEAVVKQALGGEENFARLNRVLEATKAMQVEATAIMKGYEVTKDETATRKKMQALQEAFAEKYRTDIEAVQTAAQKPEVQRYMAGLMPEDATAGLRQATLPDLVKLAGPERAEVLLRRALRLPMALQANEKTGGQTLALTRRLALEQIAALKVPSWGLTLDFEGAELFAALQARFPQEAGKPEDPLFKGAAEYHVARLIQTGRVKEAVEFADRPMAKDKPNLASESLDALERAGHGENLWQFLRLWLSRHPSASDWDRFNRLSAGLGHQEELKKFIQGLAENGGFQGVDRLRVQRLQADAELAGDDLSAATARLRASVETPAAVPGEVWVQFKTALVLMDLMALQGDAAGLDQASAGAQRLLEDMSSASKAPRLSDASDLVSKLNALDRFAAAAKVGEAALRRFEDSRKPKPSATPGDDDDSGIPDYQLRVLLGEQLRALVELDRWAEAETLITQNAGWGTKDAAGLLHDEVSSDGKPFGYYFARVALHRGDTARSRRLLEAQLVATGGADSIYSSYLEIVGQEARPLLVKLAASDHYEERPLIWLGKLQSDAGEWDAAIASLQTAIGIDPSDGEEGRGDRMRVYAYMSRAVQGKGDTAKSEFFANVVKAIRLSETADRWFKIGAYARAIALYREALGFFQDAYCIQSRLAVRLAGENKLDEAAEHYRRAFELMPDSFGRVESHCFGCEKVFAGEKSQGVAEKVFLKMLAGRPDKPQLHYLMGYLREEEERQPEAAKYYQEAVALDPLYLNAWKRLSDLDGKVKFTTAQRDDLLLKLAELDPMRRHTSPALHRVNDVARLWRTVEAGNRALAGLPSVTDLWSLTASAKLLANRTDGGFSSDSEDHDPAAILANHAFVGAVQTYLSVLKAPAEPAPAVSGANSVPR